jgi:hypothetical protein
MRPLGRPRCRWEDNRFVVKDIGWEDVDWMHLAHNRDQWKTLMCTVMKVSVQLKVENFVTE